MQSINVLSLTDDVKVWLANSRQPCVLHVFDQACNLINERREVLSIVTSQIGHGPFNLVVGDGVSLFEQISLETQVTVLPEKLTLGELTINIADGLLWNPRPDWGQLYRMRSDILYQLTSFSIPDQKLSIPSSLISVFTSSVVTADISTSVTAAQKLAGLGIGLTPTGDDFIMGAVLAMWIVHSFEVASGLAKEITDAAAPLTTSLSAAWLKSAGKGEAGQVWHDLFDTLVSADKMAVQESVDNILAIGQTSGADALTGFFCVFNSYAERK